MNISCVQWTKRNFKSLCGDTDLTVVSVIGAVKSGKSTLLNHIFANRQEIFEVKASPATLGINAYVALHTESDVSRTARYVSRRVACAAKMGGGCVRSGHGGEL